MTRHREFFINAWKHMAELDDSLAEQAADAAQRITERFTLKQNLHRLADESDHFRLEVIVRKEMMEEQNGESYPCASLQLSLPARSGPSNEKAYVHAVKLLREATQEAMAIPPVLTRIVIRFRWARRYRYQV